MESNTYQETYSEYEEIDLRELMLDIWNNKWLIIIMTFVFVLIAGIYSFFIADPVYESSSEIYTSDFKLINGSTITHDEYISFLKTSKIKGELIKKYNLDINQENMSEKIKVISNDDRRNTTLIVSDTDSILAANLLNDWVKLFTDEVKLYINNQNLSYINNLETLLLERETSYLEAEKALANFNKNRNLDLLRSRLGRDNSKLVDLESRVTNLRNDLSTLAEKKKLLTEQLARTEKFIITNETLDDSSMNILVDLLKDNSISKSFITKRENVNDIYITIQRQLNQTDLELVEKREELQLINNDIDNLSDNIVSLKAELAVLEEQQKLLNLRVSETRKNYQNSESTYNSVLQELRGRDYNISVISEAITPENPVSPRKMLNLAIATVLGVFLSVFIVFVKKFFAEDFSS